MSTEENDQYKLLPHHEQQDLCTTRLPYRQGRKLTAVKVYTINDESKHLLVFGVPSLNLRQETKTLFMKFGKIIQFNLTKYPSEQFTETYHAIYESIQAARVAKKMLDGKNYYGGHLHICYAPEMESVDDTREKMALRRTQVVSRLKNLGKEAIISKLALENKVAERLKEYTVDKKVIKINMGDVNVLKRKNDVTQLVKRKKYKNNSSSKTDGHPLKNTALHSTYKNVSSINTDSKKTDVNFSSGITDLNKTDVRTPSINIESSSTDVFSSVNISSSMTDSSNTVAGPSLKSSPVDIIDFTSTEKEVLSNINEALNYNKFGQEIIKQVPYKPVNKIKFNIKQKLI
ncbi:uncharacterized protein LOC142985441 [Anticarsia gemmatalis]|uniref:uncharacterized protein LOC142985441 n=1 Tax=Anticarsia gemmatalis TaxID=129554 RepID=UPI003F76726C